MYKFPDGVLPAGTMSFGDREKTARAIEIAASRLEDVDLSFTNMANVVLASDDTTVKFNSEVFDEVFGKNRGSLTDFDLDFTAYASGLTLIKHMGWDKYIQKLRDRTEDQAMFSMF